MFCSFNDNFETFTTKTRSKVIITFQLKEQFQSFNALKPSTHHVPLMIQESLFSGFAVLSPNMIVQTRSIVFYVFVATPQIIDVRERLQSSEITSKPQGVSVPLELSLSF